MEFELQYELDQFKEVQDQYFDEDNKCYTGVNLSTDIMEKMLSLIDNLSERVNELEPVIKQQIKALIIDSVSKSAIDAKEILDDALTRKANYSLHYVDYSKDTWTVAQELTDNRLANLLDDASIDKVRIE